MSIVPCGPDNERIGVIPIKLASERAPPAKRKVASDRLRSKPCLPMTRCKFASVILLTKPVVAPVSTIAQVGPKL